MIMIASESTQCYWQMLTRDSKHRAAPAGLFATADEPTSCMFLVPCILDARVPQAAAGLRPESRLRWHVLHVRYHQPGPLAPATVRGCRRHWVNFNSQHVMYNGGVAKILRLKPPLITWIF